VYYWRCSSVFLELGLGFSSDLVACDGRFVGVWLVTRVVATPIVIS